MRTRHFVALAIVATGVFVAATPTQADPTRSSLRFDRVKYLAGTGAECLLVTVEDPDQDLNPTAPDEIQVRVGSGYPVATASGDLETLTLVETGFSTGRFALPVCLPMEVGDASLQDGTLQVHRGDVIAAGYEDPDNLPSPPDPTYNDTSVDTALVSGGTPAGLFQFVINPAILPPQMQSTPGRLPGELPRPLAMVLAPGNVPQLFGADQVVLRSDRVTEPADFLAERQGTLVEQVSVDVHDTQPPGPGRTFHLIRVPLEPVDSQDFGYLMELLGARGNYVFSSEAAVRLLSLLLEEQVGGRFVMHNPLLLPFGQPVTAEGDCDGDGNGGDDGFACDATWMPTNDINLNSGIVYVDLMDRNGARTVDVAFIDGGFAGPADYGVGDVPDGDNNPDFGAPFAAIPQGDCASGCDGSASGPNPTMCAGGSGSPGCDWHGTNVFSIAGAVANNSFGAIGVGGHGRDAGGTDGAAGVIAPIFLKVGFPYMTTVARGVEDAVDRGADVINISSGFPCEPLGGIDICDGGTRVALTAACFAILVVIDPIPGLSCGAMLALFEESGVDDFDLLQEAVDDAVDAGIVVVASGPENVTFPILGEMGPFDAADVEMSPCILPDVICVGSIADDRAPSDYNTFGSRIDIWAPGEGLVTTPMPGGGGDLSSFGGTSAAAPFITGTAALMKGIDPTLTSQQVRDMLQRSSRMLAGGDPGGDCYPHPVLDVDGDGSPCVGYVDVLGALQEANGQTLFCGAFAADDDDDAAHATPIALPGGVGVVAFSNPASVHALPSDEDWFRFEPPDLGAPTTDISITLDVAAPLAGTLVMQISRWTPLGLETFASVPAPNGTAHFQAFLDAQSDHYVTIVAEDPAATNDNCYGGTITFRVVGPGPQPDPFEAGSGNDSESHATDLTNVAWVHRHYDEEIVSDQFTLAQQTADTWSLTIPGLSLHNLLDVDFYRLGLPDPADPRWGEGHADIDPDPGNVEPFPECGVTERGGLLGNPDTVMFEGVLTITVVPNRGAPDDELRFTNPDFATWARGEAFTKTVACPRRILSDLGLPAEVVYSFGEQDGANQRNAAVEYELRIDYAIDVQRVAHVPDWFGPDGGGGGGGGGFGMPCGGGFFGDCSDDPGGWGVYHPLRVELPVDPPCEMDGCPEYFMFNWPSSSPLDLVFDSFFDITYELFDLEGSPLAQAMPEAPGAMGANPTTGGSLLASLGGDLRDAKVAAGLPLEQAGATVFTRRLFVPMLAKGQYVLVVRGPEGVYRIRYSMRDTDGDGILDYHDNCAATYNSGQADYDHDRSGDACDCAPGDATTWAAPAEVPGLRLPRPVLGPDHVALSWMPLAYQAGPSVRYDVLTGSLPALRAGGAYVSPTCLAADVLASDIEVAQPVPAPPLPNGYWYLVRAQNACGWGGVGDGSPVPDPRDALETVECTPPAPALSIVKSDSPDPVQAGALLTYTINYQNTGNADATGVAIADALPANTTFYSATGGGSPDPSDIVRWNLGTLPAGSAGVVQLVVRVASPLPTGTIVTNDSYGIDSDQTAPVPGATVTTTVVSSPVLSITKSDSPDPVQAGGLLTYTIHYQNTGNADATFPAMTDVVPANTAFYSATGGGVHSGGVVSWSLGTLPAGGAGTVQLVVRVASPLPSGTTVTNDSYSIDCDETARVFGAAVTTTVVSAPALSISKTDSPDPVPTGGLVTYTINVGNTGNADATGTMVYDTVPSGAAFVSASDGGYLGTGGVVIWSLGVLPTASARSVQLVVRAVSGSTLTNGTYSIDSDETAPVSGSPVVTTVLPPPTVAIDLDTSTPTTINSTRTISSTTMTLDVGVIVSASGTAGIGDISRIVFGVINSFNPGGAAVTAVTPLAITDLMPPATTPYNAAFGALAGEFQFGGALVERGLSGSPFTGGPTQFARFRLTFGTPLPSGSIIRVFIGDHGPGSAAVKSASGAEISGDATGDGTPVSYTPGSDQGAGAGVNYVDAQITVGS